MSSQERIDVAAYHERTKHRFDRFSSGPDTIDWESQPDSFRRYEEAPLIKLPLNADTLSLPFSALYDSTSIPARPMGLDAIALLMETSLALSAWKQYGSAKWSLRCNPSSGNLHPTEAYLITGGIDGLDDGLYHYRADVHGLEQRCRYPGNPEHHSSTLLLGLSSVHWREAWKYGERAYRYCQLDVGHAIAAVSYAAAALGWRITPHDELGDEQLGRVLGVDRRVDFADAEIEHPDLLVSIQTADHITTDIEQLLQRTIDATWAGKANVLDQKHFYDWPVIEQVAEATLRPANISSTPALYDKLPSPMLSECSEPASKLFRRRRSAQAFDRITTMRKEDFYRLLDHLLPRPNIAPWDSQPWSARIHPVLFVHRVEGLPAGLYALPRRRDAETLLMSEMRNEFQWSKVDDTADHLPLYSLMAAKAERTATNLSCRQAIAGDSAFSIAMLAEFETNIAETPWRYRELYWEAGALGQVLYLEAEACGLRGTGIGCFFDDGVHELLGIEGKRLQCLYHFTVGAALTDQRIITLPPYGSQGE